MENINCCFLTENSKECYNECTWKNCGVCKNAISITPGNLKCEISGKKVDPYCEAASCINFSNIIDERCELGKKL